MILLNISKGENMRSQMGRTRMVWGVCFRSESENVENCQEINRNGKEYLVG